MRYTDKEGTTLNLDEHPPSDGSELIPAEVQANTRRDGNKLLDMPLAPGYIEPRQLPKISKVKFKKQ